MGTGAQPIAETGKVLTFTPNLPFRTGAAGLEITTTRDPAVMQAILEDGPFPAASDVEIGAISAHVLSGQDVTFTTPKGSVAFNAKASGGLGLGAYVHPERLLKAIAIDEHVGESFSLPEGANVYYVLLNWGYDVAASASGAVALGAPSIRFSADAEMARNFAVVRRFDTKTAASGTGAGTAIGETVASFTLPGRVADDRDIAPFTWIYALTEGDLKGSLGASYGYDFNWVREAQFGGLQGDIGLKVQASISATLGFVLSGRWAVIVGRDSQDRTVRVRVFKRRTKGCDFALNAGVNVQPTTGTLLPARMDDLIAAILGVHAPQLLKDLGALKDWASGNAPLSGALANVGSKYMLELLGHVYKAVKGPNSTFNPDRDFAAARDSILEILKTWGGLDAKISSLLWKLTPSRDESGKLNQEASTILAAVSAAVSAIAHGSRSEFATFLSRLPGLSAVLNSPVGQFLEALAPRGLLAASTQDTFFSDLQKAAERVLPFLEAGRSEQALLRAFHDWIDPRLMIDQITKAVASGTGEIKDGWLRAKIADFLQQRVFGMGELKKVDALIATLRSQADRYYAEARKALNASYGASLAATYTSTPTSTALIDAEFDFGHRNADAAALRRLLKSAIEGDLSELLLHDTPGVRLHQAMLSHGLSRHSHVELRLPFYASTIDHINSSLAAARSVEAEGRRLVVYQLDSSDEITRITNRGGNDSHLVVGATMADGSGNTTRVFGAPEFAYTYSYRQACRRMRRDQLQYQVKPYVDKYLPDAFAALPFDTWLSEMDRAVIHAPTDELGYVLLSLDLTLPSDVVAAWLQAPAEEKSKPYMDMSRALQAALRKTISFYYFADARKYETPGTASPLLAYEALPLSTSARLDGSQLHIDTGQGVYWDWMDRELRRGMLYSTPTEAKLRAMLPAIYQRLQAAGMSNTANFFEPGDGSVQRVRSEVQADQRLLESLLFTEAEIVRGALEAGLELARFRTERNRDARKAARSLARFGARVTDTFNSRVSSVYGGDALRPLGTILFVAAAQALAGTVRGPSAMLRLVVLNSRTDFAPEDFLRGQEPERGILVQQSILSAV
jgi:hypothetical protein